MVSGESGEDLQGRKKPVVMVKWDAMPDVDEPAQRHTVTLLPSKWNKDWKYVWRLDVDVDVYDNISECESEDDDELSKSDVDDLCLSDGEEE